MRRKSQGTRRSSNHRDFHDDLDIETLAVGRPTPPIVHRSPVRISSAADDRRRWAPRLPSEPQRERPRVVSGRIARVSHQPKTTPKPDPGWRKIISPLVHGGRFHASAHFVEPRKAFICLRRKARREILFALKRTGKGAKSPKRYNEWSSVRC